MPCAADHRSGSVLVAALGAEHHATGTAIPLLILSDVPGLLRWEPMEHLTVRDDLGTSYAVAGVSRQSGLGALAVTVWIVPETPVEARILTLEAREISRVSVPRGGTGVERPLSGGPWTVGIDLRPPRTSATSPADPGVGRAMSGTRSIPPRALDAFRGIIPIGQARMRPGTVVTAQAIERYADRAVLTYTLLHDGPSPGESLVDVWDGSGRYDVGALHSVVREGWTEAAVAVHPAIGADVDALGVRIAPPDMEAVEFGVAVPA